MRDGVLVPSRFEEDLLLNEAFDGVLRVDLDGSSSSISSLCDLETERFDAGVDVFRFEFDLFIFIV